MQVTAALSPVEEPPDPSSVGVDVVTKGAFYMYDYMQGCTTHGLGTVLTDILGLPKPLLILLKCKA